MEVEGKEAEVLVAFEFARLYALEYGPDGYGFAAYEPSHDVEGAVEVLAKLNGPLDCCENIFVAD